MKRIITKLISLQKIPKSQTLISRNFTPFQLITTIPQNPIQFNKNPSQNYNTQVESPSNHEKINERTHFETVFAKAKTGEEMFKAFKSMENSLIKEEVGIACLKIGLQFDEEGENPEKIVTFANKALEIFTAVRNDNNGDVLPLAMTLQLLGSVNFKLKKFNDALSCLNRAKKILGKLDEDGSDLRPILHSIEMELANVKTAMGRREEGLENLRKCLEIKESLMGKDSKEVGSANRDVALAFVTILNFKEGLRYCMKALEIHVGLLGENSVEVAYDRRLLGVIYTGLEEYEKALEQNELAQKVLKSWGRGSDLVRGEIDAANMHIALGKYEKGIRTLKGAIQGTEKDSETRAHIYLTMGKALVHQEKFVDAKRCLEVACELLDKVQKAKPSEVSEALGEISMQYETMNEFEPAISLLKRSLALLEGLPQEQHLEGSISARIGWLLLLTGKVSQAIPYLENAAETMTNSFGSKHFGVGYIYNNLGAAYLELDRPQSAAQAFGLAKDIMDVSLGPQHTDSIEACQNLSKAYAAMKSYPMAIEFQQKAVDAWEGHGRSAVDMLREARRVLKQLKEQDLDFLSRDAATKVLSSRQSSDPSSGSLRPQLGTQPPQPDTVKKSAAQPPQPDTVKKSAAQPPQPGTVKQSGTQPPQPGPVMQSGAQPPQPGTVKKSRAQTPQPGTVRQSGTQPPQVGTVKESG